MRILSLFDHDVTSWLRRYDDAAAAWATNEKRGQRVRRDLTPKTRCKRYSASTGTYLGKLLFSLELSDLSSAS